MKIKVAAAALAAGLIMAVTGCEQDESECEWELESVAYVMATKPRPPAPKAPAAKVPGAKPPAKMPVVKPPKPTRKPSKGKVWEYECE